MRGLNSDVNLEMQTSEPQVEVIADAGNTFQFLTAQFFLHKVRFFFFFSGCSLHGLVYVII